jgi:hypothetical protein
MFGDIIRKFWWVGILSIIALALVFSMSQAVLAQSPEGTPVAAPGSSQTETGVEQFPIEPESLPVSPVQSDPQPETYIGPEGELLYSNPEAIQAQQVLTGTTPVTETVGAYFNISASNFIPREEIATRAYGGAGCAYRTSSSGFFTSDLQLPKGAKIITIRAQYYDSSPVDGNIFLYSFDGTGNYQQLAQASTSGASGYGTIYSPPVNYTVDNENESLALILDYATVNDSSLRFCNIRVTYTREASLPMVSK